MACRARGDFVRFTFFVCEFAHANISLLYGTYIHVTILAQPATVTGSPRFLREVNMRVLTVLLATKDMYRKYANVSSLSI